MSKQIFRRNYFEGTDASVIEKQMEQTKRELAELERRFLEKVAETNMKMSSKCKFHFVFLTYIYICPRICVRVLCLLKCFCR